METKTNQTETPEPLSQTRRRKILQLKMVAFGLALLLCGMVIGAGGMFFWGRKLVLKNIRQGANPIRITERLETKLDLNPQQKEEVEKILVRYLPRIKDLRKNKFLLVRQEIGLMNEEISDILDENQLELWKHDMNRIMPFRRFHKSRHEKREKTGHPERPQPMETPPG